MYAQMGRHLKNLENFAPIDPKPQRSPDLQAKPVRIERREASVQGERD
jgi:hypothetical protein